MNPQAPHTLVKFDNLGRATSVSQYSSTSGLDISDVPTSLATNRMALSETFYDEKGQVWKTIRHKIDPADGSDDDTLVSLTWYDPDGRAIKTEGGRDDGLGVRVPGDGFCCRHGASAAGCLQPPVDGDGDVW